MAIRWRRYHRGVAFRDDREALKQKTRDLEHELAEANRKLEAQQGEAERARQLEAELEAARNLLNRIEAKLPKPPVISDPSPGVRKFRAAILGTLGIGVVAGGAAVFLREPPVPAAVPSVAPGDPLGAQSGNGIQVSVDLRDLVKSTPSAAPLAPVKEVSVRWLGKAKTVTGTAIKPGASCSVDALLRSNHRHAVTVRCGDELLYRSTDKLEGTAHLSAGLDEQPGEKPGTARARIQWGDIGARNGPRTQASIDSAARSASAWRDTAPPYRVDIELAELSEPYEGAFDAKHSHDALLFQDRLERRAKVSKTSGKAPIANGAACVVSLMPAWSDRWNCRAMLACGKQVLYGAGSNGFSKCDAEAGKPLAFRDELLEGDPMMTWDIAKRSVTLVAEENGAQWSAELTVSEK